MNLPSFLNKSNILEKDNPFLLVDKKYSSLLQKSFSAIGTPCSGSIPLAINELGDAVSFEYTFDGESLEVSFRNTYLITSSRKEEEYQIAEIDPARVEMNDGYHLSVKTSTFSTQHARLLHEVALLALPIKSVEIPKYFAIIKKADSHYFLYAIIMDYSNGSSVILSGDKLILVTNEETISKTITFSPAISRIVVLGNCIDFANHEYRIYFARAWLPSMASAHKFTIELSRRSALKGLCELVQFEEKRKTFGGITYDYGRQIADYAKTGWELIFHVNKIQKTETGGIYGETSSESWPLRNPTFLHPLGLSIDIMGQSVKERRTQLVVKSQYQLRNFTEAFSINMAEIDADAIAFTREGTTKPIEQAFAKGNKQAFDLGPGKHVELEEDAFRTYLESKWDTISGGKNQEDYLGTVSYPEFIVERISILPKIDGYSFIVESYEKEDKELGKYTIEDAKQRISIGFKIELSMKNKQTDNFDKFIIHFDGEKDRIELSSIRAALRKLKIARQESQDPRVTKDLFGSFGIIEAGSTDALSRKNTSFIVAKQILSNRIDFDIPLTPFKNYYVGRSHPSGVTNTDSFDSEMVIKAGNWEYIPKSIKTSKGDATLDSISILKQASYLLFDLAYIDLGPTIESFHVYFLMHSGFPQKPHARSACYVSYVDLLADVDVQSNAIELLQRAIRGGQAKRSPIVPEVKNLETLTISLESNEVFAVMDKKHPSSVSLSSQDQAALKELCDIEFSGATEGPSGKLNLPRMFESIGAHFHETSIYRNMFDMIHDHLILIMKEGILKNRKVLLGKYMRECDILLGELKDATTEYVYHMLHSIPFKSVKVTIDQDGDHKTFILEDSVPMDERTIIEVQPISSTKYVDSIPSALLVFKNASGDVSYIKLQRGKESTLNTPPLASEMQLRVNDLELVEKPEQGSSYLRVKTDAGTVTFSRTRALREEQQQTISYAEGYELSSIEKVEEKTAVGMQTYTLDWSLVNVKAEALVLTELRVARNDGIPFMSSDFTYLRRCLDILNEAKIPVYNFNDLLDITSIKDAGQVAIKIYMNPDVDKEKVASLFANLSKLETLTSINTGFGVVFQPLKTDIFNNIVEGFSITLATESPTNRKTFEAISNILFFTDEWKDVLEGAGYEIAPPDHALARFTQLGNPTAFVRMESPFVHAQRLGYMPMNDDCQGQPIDTSSAASGASVHYPVIALDPQMARPVSKTHVIEAKFPPFRTFDMNNALFRNVPAVGSFDFNPLYLEAVTAIASAYFTHVRRENDSITVHVKMSINTFEAFAPRIVEKARLAIGFASPKPRTITAASINKWAADTVARFEGEVVKPIEGKWLYINPAIDEVKFIASATGKEKNAQIADFLARLIAVRNQSTYGNEFLSNHVLNQIDPLSPLSGPLLDFHRWWGLLLEKGARDLVHEYFSTIQEGYRRLGMSIDPVDDGSMRLRFKSFDIDDVLARARDALGRAKSIAKDIDSVAGAGKYNTSFFLSPISANIELAYQYITSLEEAVRHGFVIESAISSFCEKMLPRALSILQRSVSIKEIASASATFSMGKESRDLFFEVSKPTLNPFDLLEFNAAAIKEIAKPNILRLEAEMKANPDITEIADLYSMLKQKYDGMFKPTYSQDDAETLGSPLRTLVQNSNVYYPREFQFIQEALEASSIGFPSLKKEYPIPARLFVLERNLLLPSVFNASELSRLDKLCLEIKSRLMPSNFFTGFRRALVLQQSPEQWEVTNSAKDIMESVQKHVEAAHFNDLSYLENVIYIRDPPFSRGHFHEPFLSPLIWRYYYPVRPLVTIFEGNFYQVSPMFKIERQVFLSSIDDQKISPTSFTIPEEVKVLKLSCTSVDDKIKLDIYISKSMIVKAASGISELHYEYDVAYHLFAPSYKPAHVVSIRTAETKDRLVVHVDLDNVEEEYIIHYILPKPPASASFSEPIFGNTFQGKSYEHFETFFNKEAIKFQIEGIELLDEFPFDINTLSKNVWQTVSGIIITLESGDVVHVNNAKEPELQVLVPLSSKIDGFKVYKGSQRIIERSIGGTITKEDLVDMSEDAKVGAIKEIEIDATFKNNLTFENASLIFEESSKKCFSLPLRKDQKIELGLDNVNTKGSSEVILYFLSAPDPEPTSIFIRTESTATKAEIPQEQKDLLAKLEAGIAKIESIKNDQPELYENNASILDAKIDELESQKKKIEASILAIKAQFRTTREYRVGNTYSIIKETGDTKAKLIAISRTAIDESSIQLETFERRVRYLQWSSINVEEDDSIIDSLAQKQKEALLSQLAPTKAQVTTIEGEIDLKLVITMIDLLLQRAWDKPASKPMIEVQVEKGSSSINVTIKRSDGQPFKTWKSPEAGVYSSQKEMIEVFPKKYAEYAGVKIGAQTFTEKFSILRFFFAPISMEKADVELIRETIIEYFDKNWRESWIKAEG